MRDRWQTWRKESEARLSPNLVAGPAKLHGEPNHFIPVASHAGPLSNGQGREAEGRRICGFGPSSTGPGPK